MVLTRKQLQEQQTKRNEVMKTADKHKLRFLKKRSTKIVRLYNSSCDKCKELIMQNPSRPYEDYCEECQRSFRGLIR